MIRFIYNLLWPIGLLFFLPAYLVKMVRRGGYREKFAQRLGIYGADVRAHLSKQTSTWLHAVSVGEVSRLGEQNRAAVDRGDVHATRLLANHAPRVFCD